MGCSRDHITPAHFARNIVKFQTSTGALVIIVTSNKETKTVVRNGLTHTACRGRPPLSRLMWQEVQLTKQSTQMSMSAARHQTWINTSQVGCQ